MLRLLRIKNFAIIDSLELELHGGLNAITGETGAGKSIILDAVGLILGNRVNHDVIRTGADEATVEALFDVGENEDFEKKLNNQGFDMNRSNHEIVIKRTINRNGKNKIYLNGELISLAQLADLCENLVDLCSQHEHQSLAKPVFQLDLLDRYGGLTDKRRELRELSSALRSCRSEIKALGGDEQERARAEDFLRFQLEEIDAFAPVEGEDESLAVERKRLMNSTQLLEASQAALSLLAESNDSDEVDAQTLIAKSLQRLQKAAALDPSLAKTCESLERLSMEISEVAGEISSYADALEVDPGRIETVEERLNGWSLLKKKYGQSAIDIIATRERVAKDLDELSNRQERLAELNKKLADIQRDYEKIARDLSKKRKNVAKTLTDTIQRELSELMMPATRFVVEFTEMPQTAWNADGIDQVQFLFSPNPGESPKPIAKIASGGELSRIMLAIRRTIADQGGIGVYLFDEIDAGIGGQTASVVGKKLRSVSKHNQVICITHLPQVAAYANAHYSVSKKVSGGKTSSQIVLLEQSHRIEELARMLGGLNVTEKSRAHAKDLIKQATL